MAADIFLLPTDYERTPSGLVVPGGNGEVVLAIGTDITEKARGIVQDDPAAHIEAYEAGITIPLDVFAAAALEFAVTNGLAIPTVRGQEALDRLYEGRRRDQSPPGLIVPGGAS